MYILAGIFAALASRSVLGMVSRNGTGLVIVFWAPVIEEIFKTGSAILLDTDIFFTHVTFGGVELATDSLDGRGIWPGLAALVLHSLLGYSTAWWLLHTESFIPVSVAIAVSLHALWNYTAIKMLGPKTPR